MRSTGIVRKVDELGRVVVPIELRRTLGVAEKDPLEIFTEGDMIVLKKYEPHCCLCEEVKNTVHYRGKMLCAKCIEEIKQVNL